MQQRVHNGSKLLYITVRFDDNVQESQHDEELDADLFYDSQQRDDLRLRLLWNRVVAGTQIARCGAGDVRVEAVRVYRLHVRRIERCTYAALYQLLLSCFEVIHKLRIGELELLRWNLLTWRFASHHVALIQQEAYQKSLEFRMLSPLQPFVTYCEQHLSVDTVTDIGLL